jgi:hypothetical protein
MYVIGFNGPPQSGKDSLTRLLVKEVESRHKEFPILEVSLSTPLRKIAYSMTGFRGNLDGPDYESFKTTEFPQYGGITGRQLLIDVSERFLKPCYGQEIMAKLLMASLPSWMYDVPSLVLIRDSGFQVEIDPIIHRVNPQNFLVCQVHRPNHTFHGDSREWVTHPLHAMNTIIHNSGPVEDLEIEAGRLYGRLVNQKGWKFD